MRHETHPDLRSGYPSKEGKLALGLEKVLELGSRWKP